MDEWGFDAGDEVELRGLSKVELNGQRGTLLPLEFPEQAKALGRLAVMLHSGKQLSIKVENIFKAPAADQARCCSDRGEEWGRLLDERGQSIGLPLKSVEPSVRRVGLEELPALGFGTTIMPEDFKERVTDKEYRSQVEERTRECVLAALYAGVRLFDCANMNINQQAVGRTLEFAITEGIVLREDLFIVGRIWRCKDQDEVRREVELMVRELRMEYVDLLALDLPPERAAQVWPWIEEVHTEGRARFLAASNFDLLGPRVCVEMFRELLSKTKIPPAAYCMEVHPFNTNVEMAECCRSMGIQVIAFSPLGAPHKIEAFMKALTKSDAREMRPLLKITDNPVMLEIALRHGTSAPQVALRWNLQRGHCVVPKSFDPEHISSNADLFGFRLSTDDMASIDGLHKGVRSDRFFKQSQKKESKSLPAMNREAREECLAILKKFRGRPEAWPDQGDKKGPERPAFAPQIVGLPAPPGYASEKTR